MSKELEALERLAMPDELHISECKKAGIGLTEDYEVVKQALLELQSIKEANPSEALEAFGRITLHTEYDNDSHYDGLHFEDDCKLVDKALERLEQINNANPNEALKCLESYINNIIFAKDLINQKQQLLTNITTIKQALLKAEQERKRYLKWEDLEFSYGTKEQKVRMGDTIYKISYRFFDNTDEVQLLSEDEKSVYFMFTGKFKDNVQLFNDLHLEVLEWIY